MEMDFIKKQWQDNNTFNQPIEEDTLKKMIANKNKGALNILKKNEKQGVVMMPFFVIFFLLLSIRILLHGNLTGQLWVLFIIPIGIFMWFWGRYVYRFLDKIDMSRMTVTEVSKSMFIYKTYLVRHTITAAILMPIYLAGWFYFYMGSMHEVEIEMDTFMCGIFIFMIVFSLVMFFIVIWNRFFKYTKEIQKNLKEIADFEGEE